MAVLQGLDLIEQEMAYTTWAESCKDPLLPSEYDERACRRRKGHEDNLHASGHSANGTLIVWSSVTGNTSCARVGNWPDPMEP